MNGDESNAQWKINFSKARTTQCQAEALGGCCWMSSILKIYISSFEKNYNTQEGKLPDPFPFL